MTPLGPELLALQLLTIGAICAYVGWPILAANLAPAGWAPVPRPVVDPRRDALERERDHALRALRDLDTDLELGRIGAGEHATERAQLVALAARLVAELDTGVEERS